MRDVLCMLTLSCVLCAAVVLTGCETLGSFAEGLDMQKVDSLIKVGKAGVQAAKKITPEQEYYIGRSVGATILSNNKPFDREAATRYMNVLGQTLAKASDKPETFGGYHFLILDSVDINAFAAPGGLIFITRGMLRCCKSESAVAAVLAHEIGHVQHAHGLGSIKKGRITQAVMTLAAETAKNYGSEELAQLTEAFEGSINDIINTVVSSGYARKFETQADQAAVTIMKRVGYDPHGLIDMLGQMKQQLKPGGHDFAKTHPDPLDRIKDVKKMIGDTPRAPEPGPRQKRFSRALDGV